MGETQTRKKVGGGFAEVHAPGPRRKRHRHSRGLRRPCARCVAPRLCFRRCRCRPLARGAPASQIQALVIATALASRMPALASLPLCLRLSSCVVARGAGRPGRVVAMASVSTSTNGVAQEPVPAPATTPSPPKVCTHLARILLCFFCIVG